MAAGTAAIPQSWYWVRIIASWPTRKFVAYSLPAHHFSSRVLTHHFWGNLIIEFTSWPTGRYASKEATLPSTTRSLARRSHSLALQAKQVSISWKRSIDGPVLFHSTTEARMLSPHGRPAAARSTTRRSRRPMDQYAATMHCLLSRRRTRTLQRRSQSGLRDGGRGSAF